MTLRRAAVRLRKMSSTPVLLAALLLAAGSSLQAQDRSGSRPSDSSDSPRIAVPSGGGHSSSAPPPAVSGEPRSAEPRSFEPRSYEPRSSGGETPSSSSGEPRSERGRGPRTAVPIGPGDDNEAHRQRPHNRDGGRGHGGGSWRYHDPYWGWGYRGPYWGGFWANFVLGWWYDDYFWYDRGPYYRDPYYRGPYYGDRYREDRYGALDLDVFPGRTEVYIDGRYHGKVDAYDGFPQYLWLPRGTYDVVFYLDGFRTLARQISVSPGMVIDIDDRMERGESVKPEDLATKTHERRDERLRYEEERRERLEQGRPADDDDDDEDEDEDDRMEEWRERAREHRRDRDSMENDGREDREDREREDEARGRLLLDVEPEDASVYLDGRFVGTGEELGNLRRGLPVDAGKHHLAVVRPGHRPEERDFEVEAGEEVELDVELESGSR